jgi:hypothetical protein
VYNDELKEEGAEYEVEEILDSKKKGQQRQYLVRRVGWDQQTWEPEIHLRNSADKIQEFDQKNPDKA